MQRTIKFNIERSTCARIESLLGRLHGEGVVDYWGHSIVQNDPTALSIDFGSRTNLAMVVLQVNSRLLLEEWA